MMFQNMTFNESPFFRQAELMVKILPLLNAYPDFAIKGGTAINFFIQDLDRLSVDIDLTYTKITERTEAVRTISGFLEGISDKIKRLFPEAKIRPSKEERSIRKIFVNRGDINIKIEPNFVLRGTVFPPVVKPLCKNAQALFESYLECNILAVEDLYAGKICAALDRQHPRDFFDMMLFLENQALTESIRKAFIVYLISHDRPIAEVLAPNLVDFRDTFEKEFKGMTEREVSYEDLLRTRDRIMRLVKTMLTVDEKNFLLSVKDATPQWELLGLENIENLPAVRWKLVNIGKMDPQKRKAAFDRLKNTLFG
jgi:predicted nucleotidyltransferase component of viral defense system